MVFPTRCTAKQERGQHGLIPLGALEHRLEQLHDVRFLHGSLLSITPYDYRLLSLCGVAPGVHPTSI